MGVLFFSVFFSFFSCHPPLPKNLNSLYLCFCGQRSFISLIKIRQLVPDRNSNDQPLVPPGSERSVMVRPARGKKFGEKNLRPFLAEVSYVENHRLNRNHKCIYSSVSPFIRAAFSKISMSCNET